MKNKNHLTNCWKVGRVDERKLLLKFPKITINALGGYACSLAVITSHISPMTSHATLAVVYVNCLDRQHGQKLTARSI